MGNPQAFLDWKASSYTPGQAATLVYTVDTPDPLKAIALCIVAAGSTHPLDANLIADMPRVEPLAQDLLKVTWSFTRADQNKTGGEQDPLKFPPRLRWKIGTSSETRTKDAKGRVVVNLAGQPFAQGLPFDTPSLFLTVERNEKTFDLQQAMNFTPSINSDDFKLLKRYDVKKGQCKCHGIEPGDYTTISPYVTKSYNFEFREDGFRVRVLNQGKVGWYKDPKTGQAKTGRFFDEDLSPADDVLLDRVGIPIEENFRFCTKRRIPAVPNPHPPKLDKDEIEFALDGSIWLLYPMEDKQRKFAGLL